MVRQFPRLVNIQRAVYGITASAVDVETIWSKMKLVATRLRANLTAARAGQESKPLLLCTRKKKSVCEI